MDKRTLLAVVISVVILIGGSFLQYVLFPPAAPKPAATQPAAPVTTTGSQSQSTQTSAHAEAAAPSASQTTGVPAGKSGAIVAVAETGQNQNAPETFTRETSRFRLVFSRVGGVLTSIQLREFKNADGSPVEMVLSSKDQYPFEVSFGDYKTPWTTDLFDIKETVDSKGSLFEFSRSFLSATGVPFTLRKTYRFVDDEYMMELAIAIENSVNEVPNLGQEKFAYTLSIGPQIGPFFKKLDGRSEYRSFMYYAGGRKDLSSLSGQVKELAQQVTWVGIVGKYFTILAVPDATQYTYEFDAQKIDPALDRSTLFIQRPVVQAAKTRDVFRFYIGPKKRDALGRYNDAANNSFGLGTLHMDEVITSPFLIGWLAQLLNYLLILLYAIIPNYGVAIILVTLIIKLLFLPLTFKSSEATARMSTLNPKIMEIRSRLKDKPEKMNQEIAELYRREKINPLSGCLPMLLQLPILWAIYSLLNDFFELRGAAFIPGWIPDLSAPESIWNWGISIPLLGQNLRLLPFLMLATQFLASRFATPQASAQQGAQMKILAYALPAVFFFILYEMPSGLVLYWTVQNILSIFQQLYINYRNKQKKESAQDVVTVKYRRK
jgi:YidC/Oxa1 family membrane protein insertase